MFKDREKSTESTQNSRIRLLRYFQFLSLALEAPSLIMYERRYIRKVHLGNVRQKVALFFAPVLPTFFLSFRCVFTLDRLTKNFPLLTKRLLACHVICIQVCARDPLSSIDDDDARLRFMFPKKVSFLVLLQQRNKEKG